MASQQVSASVACTLRSFVYIDRSYHLHSFRYDPTADLPSEIDTEQDRVIFIQSLAQFMVLLCTHRLIL